MPDFIVFFRLETVNMYQMVFKESRHDGSTRGQCDVIDQLTPVVLVPHTTEWSALGQLCRGGCLLHCESVYRVFQYLSPLPQPNWVVVHMKTIYLLKHPVYLCIYLCINHKISVYKYCMHLLGQMPVIMA